MVKPEKFGCLHLVYHFTVPLRMKKIFFFMLEHLHCFYFFLGHDVRLKQFQVGQTLITIGHCSMASTYFQSCIPGQLKLPSFSKFQHLSPATYQLHLQDYKVILWQSATDFLNSLVCCAVKLTRNKTKHSLSATTEESSIHSFKREISFCTSIILPIYITGPILESKGLHAIFQKKGKKC